jgi:hypothetical protein
MFARMWQVAGRIAKWYNPSGNQSGGTSEVDLPEDPDIPKRYPTKPQGHVPHYVHRGLNCDRQKLETAQMPHNR